MSGNELADFEGVYDAEEERQGLLYNVLVAHKLWLLIGLAILSTVFVMALSLMGMQTSLLEDRKDKTRNVVETAYGAMVHFQKLEKERVMTREEAQRMAVGTIKDMRYDEKNYFWINDMRHIGVMHPFKDRAGQDLSEFKIKHRGEDMYLYKEFVDAVKDDGTGYVFYSGPRKGTDKRFPKLSFLKRFPEWDWVIGSGVYIDDIDRVFWENAKLLISTTIVVMALLGFFVFRLYHSITKPLKSVFDKIISVEKNGKFSVRAEKISGDEIGKTVDAFNALMASMESAVKEVNLVMESVDSGDFSQRVEIDLKGDLNKLKNHVNTSSENLRVTMYALREVLLALSEGNFKRRLSSVSESEINKSIDSSLESMETIITDINQIMGMVARGDLSNRVSVEAKGHLGDLKDNINNSIEALGKTLQVIAKNTRQVAAAAVETSEAISQVAEGAANQLNVIEQIAISVKESNEGINEVAQSTEMASSKAGDATRLVKSGQEKVAGMVEAVGHISSTTEKILKINKVIGNIANQTNMLALNAAIEAGRAKEHGRGFAVVAEEVRKLSENVAGSVEEISQLIERAVKEASSAVDIATTVHGEMEKIVIASTEANETLQRIASAMEEQTYVTKQISANMDTLMTIGDTNSSAAEQITATIISLSKLADETRQQIEQFQLLDNKQ